ncbi:response regulator [Halorarum halobium]|uniref:response regulator n=1 Tax=Halorarum halobium TaxID=3075121 RepID=UPI0028ADC659|nr:response regulator [Halobaculum sp. XH14]
MTGSIRVLYVDGDGDAAETASESLERESGECSVRTRATAADALAAALERPPDCLVTDAELPDCDGLSLLERVRREVGDVPGILFTDDAPEAVVRTALGAEGTDFVSRSGPAAMPALADRIEGLGETRRTMAGLQQREAHARALTEAASDVIVTIDEGSEITSVNRAGPSRTCSATSRRSWSEASSPD